MEYPLMLFKGGDITAEYRIVPNKAGEEAAQPDGFVRAGATKPDSKPKPKGKPE